MSQTIANMIENQRKRSKIDAKNKSKRIDPNKKIYVGDVVYIRHNDSQIKGKVKERSKNNLVKIEWEEKFPGSEKFLSVTKVTKSFFNPPPQEEFDHQPLPEEPPLEQTPNELPQRELPPSEPPVIEKELSNEQTENSSSHANKRKISLSLSKLKRKRSEFEEEEDYEDAEERVMIRRSKRVRRPISKSEKNKCFKFINKVR